MSLKHAVSIDSSSRGVRPNNAPPPSIHRHLWRPALSRRQFMRGVAGVSAAATLAAVFGSDMLAPGKAFAVKGSGEPNPIPSGLDIGGTLFHVRLPGLAHPANDEPSVITDFKGSIGYSVIDGMGTRTQISTGETQHLPFETDLRFMNGTFVGTDGRRHRGTFALV